MTVPVERTNAVIQTEKFLLDLLDPKKTPRVPREVRVQARSLLKHYPHEHEMEKVAKEQDSLHGDYGLKVFGRSWK